MAKIKTRARTLDMLGRQQIAGIPTALSELFKNAHDAYADNVEVDYIRKKNLLILRDNGLGMTLSEFEDRWLTIGTDSKFDDEDAIEKPAIDMYKDKRPVMGEKGIGRLAIAAIGPQVLVMTRSKREDGLGELVLSFINWSLFSLAGLDLSDIDIPILTKQNGENANFEDVEFLKHQAIENVKNLSNKISASKIHKICNEIQSFSYDPEFWRNALNRQDENSGLIDNRDYLQVCDAGYGTHFIISPVDFVITNEIDESDDKEVSKLKRVLLGFSNTIQNDRKPRINASFRDHNLAGETIDHIAEQEFFTHEDVELADHYFAGNINQFGQFSGKGKIFKEVLDNVPINWKNIDNTPISCGPFKIILAAVQGTKKDTLLSPELHEYLRGKTIKLGGIYIYRDDIRVLPYGGPDVDFFGVEKRRTYRAADSYFSNRNMICYIELTRENNSTLQEKAGREGFIENKAYKQFRSIIENFFISVAKQYFVDSGELAETFKFEKDRNKKNYEALEKRAKLKNEKKKQLVKDLDVFFENFKDENFASLLLNKKIDIENKIYSFNENLVDYNSFITGIESEKIKFLEDLKSNFNIKIPNGLGFNREISNLIDKFNLLKNEFQVESDKFNTSLNKIFIDFENKHGNKTDLKKRVTDSLLQQEESYKKSIEQLYTETNRSIKGLADWATKEIRKNKEEGFRSLLQLQTEVASIDFSNKSNNELIELKSTVEKQFQNLSETVSNSLKDIQIQINTSREQTSENTLSSARLVSILETEYEVLKEHQEENLEMIQLGMAFGVIHHEFNHNILRVRRGIKDLSPWAKANPKLQEIYNNIRTGFDHLDGYLRTFIPLSRRLTRRKSIITGAALRSFLEEIFTERLEKENVEMLFTNEFLNFRIQAFSSTIYPAIVNLVDNAIYWASQSSSLQKKVTLHADNEYLFIADTGPGVPLIDRENIFEFGFSRKIGGRGMGLYIVRQTLERDGFNLELEEFDPKIGAVFKISQIEVGGD
ncbi:ATP-binding protein [Acinetobacter apis]|uniref:histidine kinase n=1 Tax=Acinetobacter apis TaxID=1229165 RepID=A0A217EIL5_9GAMM|nr:ATP-binding protein [Acinetobacter apis]SNQ30247.1 Signal transduction histidine kinase [Acinetobacter apis]